MIHMVAGILVPDLCLEETEVMQAATKAAGLELTQLVTPTTPQERMKRIAAVSEGFVYLVSVTGVCSGQGPICCKAALDAAPCFYWKGL